MSKILLGLGAGQCGLKLLADILNAQPGVRMTCEDSPLLPWEQMQGHLVGSGGLHSEGWNNDWQKFFDKNPQPKPEDISKQLENMKKSGKYKELLEHGVQAPMDYKTWGNLDSLAKKNAFKSAKSAAANKAAQTITKNLPSKKVLEEAAEAAAKKATKKAGKSVGKKIGKKIGKAIPGVGIVVSFYCWGSDVQAKGPVYGTLNSGLDAIPYVGLVKGVVEIGITGDIIPDMDP